MWFKYHSEIFPHVTKCCILPPFTSYAFLDLNLSTHPNQVTHQSCVPGAPQGSAATSQGCRMIFPVTSSYQLSWMPTSWPSQDLVGLSQDQILHGSHVILMHSVSVKCTMEKMHSDCSTPTAGEAIPPLSSLRASPLLLRYPPNSPNCHFLWHSSALHQNEAWCSQGVRLWLWRPSWTRKSLEAVPLRVTAMIKWDNHSHECHLEHFAEKVGYKCEEWTNDASKVRGKPSQFHQKAEKRDNVWNLHWWCCQYIIPILPIGMKGNLLQKIILPPPTPNPFHLAK